MKRYYGEEGDVAGVVIVVGMFLALVVIAKDVLRNYYAKMAQPCWVVEEFWIEDPTMTTPSQLMLTARDWHLGNYLPPVALMQGTGLVIKMNTDEKRGYISILPPKSKEWSPPLYGGWKIYHLEAALMEAGAVEVCYTERGDYYVPSIISRDIVYFRL